ncbi:cupin domain-containing protein [Halolamina rubra]|uniref:cupin domain-containing protein n=1 Tax=Halolamina rubra TaxID=1380430 RepID=UPI0006797522|nr:cupin domain-containing protein [Halolamina rubra]
MPEITAIDDLTETPHAEVFERTEPRAVRLGLDAGDEVPPHTHPGTNVVLHLLDGRLDLSLDGESHELEPGDVARFSGEREISPRAIEASTALVVFAPTA